MIKNVLSHLAGVEIYGVISITLFFAFFVGMLVWAIRLKRRELEVMGRIPLEDGSLDPVETLRSEAVHEQ